MSSTASNEVAESFLHHDHDNQDANVSFQAKTILKFIHPQGLLLCADVSWLSPFPDEREIIINGCGMAICEPPKWDLTKFDQNYYVKTVNIASCEKSTVYKGADFLRLVNASFSRLCQ